MFDVLLDSWWIGPALWAAFYISDYRMTIAGARLYKAQSNVVFEGSYEITPGFQADVDALKTLSPRFVIYLAASTAYLGLVRWIASTSEIMFSLYGAVLGGLLLLQATIHIRHLRNWFMFSKGAGLMQGRLSYSRSLTLRMSAFELFLFAVLYFGLFIVTPSSFLLGGALLCAGKSVQHYRLARKQDIAASGVVAIG